MVFEITVWHVHPLIPNDVNFSVNHINSKFSKRTTLHISFLQSKMKIDKLLLKSLFLLAQLLIEVFNFYIYINFLIIKIVLYLVCTT